MLLTFCPRFNNIYLEPIECHSIDGNDGDDGIIQTYPTPGE